jgi:hypothetical protein
MNKDFIKGAISAFAIMLMVVTLQATAGDITATGMSQKDRFTFYSNVVTMANESKADYNLLEAHVASADLLLNQIRAVLVASSATGLNAAVSTSGLSLTTTTDLTLTGL